MLKNAENLETTKKNVEKQSFWPDPAGQPARGPSAFWKRLRDLLLAGRLGLAKNAENAENVEKTMKNAEKMLKTLKRQRKMLKSKGSLFQKAEGAPAG